MKKNFSILKKILISVCFLFILIASGCENPPEISNEQEKGLIRIFIGEEKLPSRTIQPEREAIAGYQLTFSGPGTIAPMTITEGNSVDILLANGTWTVTATAYKLNGIIGRESDAIASGFISIRLSGGIVSGSVPPIILTPINNTGIGIFNYIITIESGISGYMKLLKIDGDYFNSFGENGELSLSNSVNVNYNLATGRYIIEIRLENEKGEVSYFREVLEIWEGTKTILIYEPLSFFDPNIKPPTLNFGDFSVTNIEFSGITYINNILTIINDGTYTIGMKDGSNITTTTDRIVISSGVNANIIFSNISINRSSTSNTCAFDISGATVNITLIGNNEFISGSSRAGIQLTSSSTLVINELSIGSLTATGGSSGAGIGSSGTIIINSGTITATGGSSSVGISGNNISINGGLITAISNSWNGAISGAINNIGGNSIVFASSSGTPIQSSSLTGATFGNSVVFNGANGIVYGNPIIKNNITIPSGRELSINNEQSLKIENGYSITNNGVMFIDYFGNLEGTVSGNKPIRPSFTIFGDTGFTYSARLLTITENGTYSIKMIDGVTSTNLDRIVVSSGVIANITLSNVNIDRSGNSACAFDMAGATVNLTLIGDNNLKSGSSMSGIRVPRGATLVITKESTGSLTATGSSTGSGNERIGAAGIGGSNGTESGGIININGGTITAIGTSSSAGIGGAGHTITGQGYNSGQGGTVSIANSTVTAIGGTWGTNNSNRGPGIGGGVNSSSGNINYIGDNAILFASFSSSLLPTGTNLGSAIIFNNSTSGIIYGDVITLKRNVIIPSDIQLVIGTGKTVKIENGYTLTNNGEIFKAGGTIEGTIIGNLPIERSFSIVGNTAYTYIGEILTIIGSGSCTISMTSGVTSTPLDRIVVASGVNANIILSNVNINLSNINNACAFDMTGATVNLTLLGDNVLRSGSGRAGLHTPSGSTLLITAASIGTLTAIGGQYGAGIGGSDNARISGNITISGGTITARGSAEGAGIGGGRNGNGGTTNITGGIINAIAGNSGLVSGGGAGIGGGRSGSGGTITISGGMINANSSEAGIGGGGGGAGGVINISGGTIIAKGSFGAGIGGGCYGSGGTINITGGTITASGDVYSDYYGGPGIGGGYEGSSGTINTIGGNALIFASAFSRPIQPLLPTGSNMGPVIIFSNSNGTMYGNVTLPRNETIPSDKVLIIKNGQTLKIETGYSLTNNGVIILENGGNIIGQILGNQPTAPSFIISGSSNYSYTEGILKITGNGTYNIGMRNGVTSTTSERIIVSPGVTANISLSNVNINMSSTNNICAFDITGATVNLTLVGDNILRSGENKAGIQVPEGAFLEISNSSTGTLTVTGGRNGAGIGGGDYVKAGSITIKNGTINSTGGYNGAGIGGGNYGQSYPLTVTGGNINITGGIITATGGTFAAGIGGGCGGAGGILSITGGIITANDPSGTGIGSGGFYLSGIGFIYGSNEISIETIGGNAVIITSGMPTTPNDGSWSPSVIISNNNGIVYGNFILMQNITLTSNMILTIPNGQKLSISNGITLTNNGVINNFSNISNSGTINNHGTINNLGIINNNSPINNIIGNQPIDVGSPIPLTINTWGDGSTSSSVREQWFSFTATAATQYIHISFGTLTDLYVQLYDHNFQTVGNRSNLNSSSRSISRTSTSGKVYYIRVWPYSSSGSGTFRITFNTSSTVPAQ